MVSKAFLLMGLFFYPFIAALFTYDRITSDFVKITTNISQAMRISVDFPPHFVNLSYSFIIVFNQSNSKKKP